MRKLCPFSTVLIGLLFNALSVQCQQITVQTDVGKQVVLSRVDIEGLPHIKVTVSEHSSAPLTFEGVPLKSVLEKVGVTFGESIRGKLPSSITLGLARDYEHDSREASGLFRSN